MKTTNNHVLNESDCAPQIVIAELQGQINRLEREHERYQIELNILREQNKKLLQMLFGPKSEKYILKDDFEQASLFPSEDESPKASGLAEGKNDEEAEFIEEITVPEHKRKKGGRKPLPEHLERVDILHDLPEEEKECSIHKSKKCIGQKVSEKLVIIPAKFYVVRHIRLIYACPCDGIDEGGEGDRVVKIAPVPVQILPKSIASPSLLAHIFVKKFCDALPFYRQEGIFRRMSVGISRATMCAWAIKVAEKCSILIELFILEILAYKLINIDETTVQVLHEEGRKASSNSYMWLFLGGEPDKPVRVYHYSESRSGDVAANFLGDNYQGYVQTDGYSGYNFLDSRPGIVALGCWAHVRRKFVEVLKAGSPGAGVRSNSDSAESKSDGAYTGLAGKALGMISQLYKIESEVRAKGLSVEEVYIERQTRSRPILDKFELWLKEKESKAPPKSLLGKAFTYTSRQWPRLVRYVDDGCLRMDNNLAENAIRPFVVGRKNWLFFDRPEGASAGATLYSIIETAKANGLEPYKYLCYLFDRLPFSESKEDLKKLLPWNVSQEFLVDYHNKMHEEFNKKH